MKLNLSDKNIHIGAIATFYIIALLVRLISLLVVNKFPSIETNYALQVSAALATGLGPAIGALVAMLLFKRKTEYTLVGKSARKSIATIVIPCIVFGIIGGWDLGLTCFWAFAYGLLEEFGWRGFLQYELRELPVWQYVLIITIMWFLWHLDLSQRSVLPFFLLLLFASWGIGKVVTDTHSLLFCAAFHGIVNFSKRALFSDTTFTAAFICVIVYWIVMWYFVGTSPKQQSRDK
ncbi:CPBP family intramembrane metalloprotease [Segatella bryantii]|uniref:CPBP family intramembrane glutamic endopeptidase n=1 Tax=Segatella bryantii TaxID=77095 RepID=UPI001EDB7359|nr:CPBP family intramembrane glutamic endopeptidase [Segatella bryantii]UKK73431.1 CPBP family intramembrane metalloprotease [Segatella bryantii]